MNVTPGSPRAMPQCLAIEPVLSVLEGYLDGPVPPVIEPTRTTRSEPGTLSEALRSEIGQAGIAEVLETCDQCDFDQMVGRPCWLGDDKRGLVPGICLRPLLRSEGAEFDALVVYVQGEDARSSGESVRVDLDLGDAIHYLRADVPTSEQPGFWMLRDDLPDDDGMVPDAPASESMLEPINANPELHLGKRVFLDGALMAHAVLEDPGDGVSCQLRLDGVTERLSVDITQLLAPAAPDTPPRHYAFANKFDALRIGGRTVHCWGTHEKRSDRMCSVRWSSTTACWARRSRT